MRTSTGASAVRLSAPSALCGRAQPATTAAGVVGVRQPAARLAAGARAAPGAAAGSGGGLGSGWRSTGQNQTLCRSQGGIGNTSGMNGNIETDTEVVEQQQLEVLRQSLVNAVSMAVVLALACSSIAPVSYTKWVLPAAPWRGAAVTIVLTACATLQLYLLTQHLIVASNMMRRCGTTFKQALASAAVLMAVPKAAASLVVFGLSLLAASHTFNKPLFGSGLFEASASPVAWVPAVTISLYNLAPMALSQAYTDAVLRTAAGEGEGAPTDQVHRALAGALNSPRKWREWLLGSAVLMPIYEELLFRGFLLPSLALWLPPACAVAVSAMLFAMCHGFEGSLEYIFIGCIFGCAYSSTGNLMVPIILHMLIRLYHSVQIDDWAAA